MDYITISRMGGMQGDLTNKNALYIGSNTCNQKDRYNLCNEAYLQYVYAAKSNGIENNLK